MSTATKQIEELANTEYKYGFVTDVEQDIVPVGLDEGVVRLISSKKGEPQWLLDWRLKAFRAWLKMTEPHWQNVTYAPIDYQGVSYYAAPSEKKKLSSLDEVDPEIRATFNKLGIPIEEQKLLSNVAVDAVFDSVSVATTFRSKLAELGIIFCLLPFAFCLALSGERFPAAARARGVRVLQREAGREQVVLVEIEHRAVE